MNNSKENKSKIFVTGATGFLGANLVTKLLKLNYIIYAAKRSTSNMSRYNDSSSQPIWVDLETICYEKFFKDNSIDSIIHCATDYGRKNTEPIQTLEANLILPLKIISAASGLVKSFINTDTILAKDINNYSLSKKQFCDWLKIYSTKIVAINIALEHFYGPGDDITKFTANVINSMISCKDEINLTSGMQKRDFVYIDDVVNAIILIINSSESFEKKYHSFEVGSGESISIKDYVELVKEISGNKTTKLNFGAIPYRENEVMNVKADISKLTNLGWKPNIMLLEGLKLTIDFEKNK